MYLRERATYRQDAATKRQPVSSSSQLQRFQSSKIPWWSDVVAVTPMFLASNCTIQAVFSTSIERWRREFNSFQGHTKLSPLSGNKNLLDSAMKLT